MKTALRVVLLAVALLVAQAVLGSALLATAEGAEAGLPLLPLYGFSFLVALAGALVEVGVSNFLFGVVAVRL